MTPSQILFLQTQAGTLLLKFGFLVLFVLVAMFLFIVLTQIRSMNRIITQPDMFPYLQSFVVFLMLCTLALTIVTLVIL